jgi:chromosomal replication initiation ATPase DnaA
LGGQKFIAEKIDKLEAGYKLATQPDINRIKKLLEIEDLSNYVTRYFNIPISQLKTARQKNNLPRLIAIYLARNLIQSSHKNISEYFTGLKRFSVSTLLIRCRDLIEQDPVVNTHYLKIKKIIKEEL